MIMQIYYVPYQNLYPNQSLKDKKQQNGEILQIFKNPFYALLKQKIEQLM